MANPRHIIRGMSHPTETIHGYPIRHETRSSRRLPRLIMVHGHARPLIHIPTSPGTDLFRQATYLNGLLHGTQSYPDEEPHCCLATPLIPLLEPDSGASARLVRIRWTRLLNHVLANLESPPSCLTPAEVDHIAEELRQKFHRSYPGWQKAALREALKLIHEPYDIPDEETINTTIARCFQGHAATDEPTHPLSQPSPDSPNPATYFNTPCTAGRASIITLAGNQYIDIPGVSLAEIDNTCSTMTDNCFYMLTESMHLTPADERLVQLGIHPRIRCGALRTAIDAIDTCGFGGEDVVKALEGLVRHVAAFLPVDVDLKRSEVRQLVRIARMRSEMERLYMEDGEGKGHWEVALLARIAAVVNRLKDARCLSHRAAVGMMCFMHVHQCEHEAALRGGATTQRRGF